MSVYAFNDNLEKVPLSGLSIPFANVSAQSEATFALPSELANLMKPTSDFVIVGLNQSVPGGNRTDKLFANNKVYPFYTYESDTYVFHVYNPSTSAASILLYGGVIRVKETEE